MKLRTLCLIGIFSLGLFGCSSKHQSGQYGYETAKAKNVILLIGDGMGPQQIGLLTAYAKYGKTSPYADGKTAISRLMADSSNGLSMTNPYNALVNDSAGSATQLATGQDSRPGLIGLNQDGDIVETVLERAKKMGKVTGLVSDTRLTHATPAAFAAHQVSRNLENAIAEDMLANNVDVMLSGGLRYFIPKSVNDKGATYNAIKAQVGDHIKVKSKRKDNKNLLVQAKSQGYELVFDREQLAETDGNKVLGLFAYSAMPDAIQASQAINDPERKVPSLKEMTVKALDILAQHDEGFFLMVEGGQIDWAGHSNDAGTLLHEMLRFDETIEYVYEWAKKRQDTLVVLTADHETGGFGMSYSGFRLPQPIALTGEKFSDVAYKQSYNFGPLKVLDKLAEQEKSFYQMVSEFERMPQPEQTPEALAKIVNESSAFKITRSEAKQVLAKEKNRYQYKGHEYLDVTEVPVIRDFKVFYPYGNSSKRNLLGRVLAKQQNTVWSTATHTHTPVIVVAMGPESIANQFSGIQSHVKVGQNLMDAVSH